MDRQKLNRITALFLTAVVLIVALMLFGSLRRPERITLPAETGNTGTATGDPAEDHGALAVVEVTPETVQTAIETLARPTHYRRSVSVQHFWSGGSGTLETTVTVRGKWTRLDRTLADHHVRHVITDGETTYIWYNSARAVYTAPAGELTADVEQEIPTYEDILSLPKEKISVADYRSIDNRINCIYVETTEVDGYVLRYWVSVDTGLLVAAEKLLDGETTYRMWETASELEPAITVEFTLPDGTVLAEN